MTSPQGEFNFRFKLASPKFIICCTRNCPITNLSSTVQIPVTSPSNYISRKSKFFRKIFLAIFYQQLFELSLFEQKQNSSKLESNKRFIVFHRSLINRLLDSLFLAADDDKRNCIGKFEFIFIIDIIFYKTQHLVSSS